ncbi:WYL domain-containing protein [Paenibacillus selenitireducens]|uniref:WYL domain-containing protein n=1 Tax=Paenibacillus selenitireducens TaxID=1324314 RepID=A0A1T2XMF2_9BACL|nr:WYL domain-containing protein [Paenibacillus selenitireducens]OPA81060.1 WYL domain-containing protein [Paenibacillus selenitireducens]
MQLFEKIFNYQLLSRIEEQGAFMITSQERTWLKTMLQHPSAHEAFSPVTLDKLQTLLRQDATFDVSTALLEKAGSKDKHVYHPHLRTLRRLILRQTGVQLTYKIKDGRIYHEEAGYAYKLEYSMVKREWYLLWYNLRRRTLMHTRLQQIVDVAESSITPTQIEHIQSEIESRHAANQRQATILVLRRYNRELSRILYAFSCFEKDINYDEAQDSYTIQLTFLQDESEYILSKLRFLGMRVKVIESEHFKQRMYESATRALARYDETTTSEANPTS